MTPLKSFVGNSCTAAMTSFQTVSATEACLGVRRQERQALPDRFRS